jgi:hypothetical protein
MRVVDTADLFGAEKVVQVGGKNAKSFDFLSLGFYFIVLNE